MSSVVGATRSSSDGEPTSAGPECVRRSASTAGTPLVLAAARQEHQKGLDVLVESVPNLAATHPDLVVAIAGREGNESARLRATVERLAVADHVRFLGARDDVLDLLAAADVFVLPSRREGFGSVLVEALALEAPIVASDIGPVREVLGVVRRAGSVGRSVGAGAMRSAA